MAINNHKDMILPARARLWAVLLLLCIPSAKAASALVDDASNAQERQAQAEYIASNYLNDLFRAERIVHALRTVAAPYCPSSQRLSLGVAPVQMRDLPRNIQQALKESRGYKDSDPPRLLFRLNQSAFNIAALQLGDLITGIKGYPDKALPEILSLGFANTRLARDGVEVSVRRGETTSLFKTHPLRSCKIGLRLIASDKPTIETNGPYLTVSIGTLHRLPSDDELAFVVAQEIAVNILRSNPGNTPVGAKMPQQINLLASYLSIAANFSPEKGLYARLKLQMPHKLSNSALLSPEQTRNLKSTISAIRRKQKAGDRLMPEPNELPFAFQTDFVSFEGQPPQVAAERVASAVDPRLYDINAIPFVNETGRTGYQRFLATPIRPRAYAISTMPPSGGSAAWQFNQGSDAISNALAGCAIRAGRPCFLYAVDDEVVWNPMTAKLTPDPDQSTSGALAPPIGPPPPSDFARIDDIDAVPLNPLIRERYRAFLEKPSPRAFIIMEDGMARYWIGPRALESAVAYCSEAKNPCWLYAVDNNVVWYSEKSKRVSRRDQLPKLTDESQFLGR